MDIKVSQTTPVSQPRPSAEVQPSDGTFKFTLASRIEEHELQARLTAMMEEITMQGKKLGKHRDVKDMKRYRSLIKGFLNEVVSR